MIEANAQAFLKTMQMHPSDYDLTEMTDGFLCSMRQGIRGKSDIPMLDTGLLLPDGPVQLGNTAVIDAGGTWLRTALLVEGAVQEQRCVPMPRAVSWTALINAVAEQILPFARRARRIGFCFAYPLECQTDGGKVLRLGKEIGIQNAEGQYPAADLTAALVRYGCVPESVRVVNDAAAALLGGILQLPVSYDGCVSLLCGSGMNSACAIWTAAGETRIINCESGGYSKLKQGVFDRQLDDTCSDQGMAIAEKMTAGAYLPELWHRTLCAAGTAGFLARQTTERLKSCSRFSGAEMDAFCREPEGDNRPAHQMEQGYDAWFAREIAVCLLLRAAKILCANVTAMLQLTGQGRYKKYPAAIVRQGAMLEQNSLLPQMLDQFLQTFTRQRCGIYTVNAAVEQVIWKGTAAAVWTEQTV